MLSAVFRSAFAGLPRASKRRVCNPKPRTDRLARTLPRKPQMLPHRIFRAQGSPSPTPEIQFGEGRLRGPLCPWWLKVFLCPMLLAPVSPEKKSRLPNGPAGACAACPFCPILRPGGRGVSSESHVDATHHRESAAVGVLPDPARPRCALADSACSSALRSSTVGKDRCRPRRHALSRSRRSRPSLNGEYDGSQRSGPNRSPVRCKRLLPQSRLL
jgi:hypothetical protein